jgi:hypothetical protein
MADNVNRLLIVDEDSGVAHIVGRVARNAGYNGASATAGAALVEILE